MPDPAILFDALRLVRQARVSLSAPLAPGSLFPGLSVKEGTIARVELEVREGALDLEGAKVELLPALDGPLFTHVKEVGFGADRRLAVRIGGFPDLKLGPPVPARVDALADWLRDGLPGTFGVRVFGVKVGSVSSERVAELGPDPRALLQDPNTPGAPQLEGVRVQVTDVVLDEGVLLLGPLGRIRIGCDAGGTLEVEGGELHLEADLRWSDTFLTHGDFNVSDAEGRGRLSIDVRWNQDEPALQARVESLSLRTGAFEGKLRNGDFVRLTSAHCEGGTIALSTPGNGELPRVSAELPRAGGSLERAKVTLPFEGRPTPIEARDSSFEGHVHLSEGSLRIGGEVTVHGRIARFQPSAGVVALDLYDCELDGDAEISLDLEKGATLIGRGLRARTCMREAWLRGWLEQVRIDVADGSTAELDLERLVLMPSGHMVVDGEGELSLRLHRMQVRQSRGQLEGDAARMEGRARVRLDTREGVELSEARMGLVVAHWGLELHLPVGIAGRADGRCSIQLGDARVDVERELFELEKLQDGRVRADITRGWVQLPSGQRIRVRDGSRMELSLRDARLTNHEGLSLHGQATVEARLEADDDLLTAIALVGLDLGEVRADRHLLKVTLDGVDLHPDGTFLLRNLRVGVQSDVETLSGRLVLEELT